MEERLWRRHRNKSRSGKERGVLKRGDHIREEDSLDYRADLQLGLWENAGTRATGSQMFREHLDCLNGGVRREIYSETFKNNLY